MTFTAVTTTILASGVGIFVLFLVCKLLKVSAKIIIKLVWNGICGMVVLFIFNLIGGIFGLTIELTALNAVITGILGIPGVILLLLIR